MVLAVRRRKQALYPSRAYGSHKEKKRSRLILGSYIDWPTICQMQPSGFGKAQRGEISGIRFHFEALGKRGSAK